MANEIAPDRQVFVCRMCGKRSKDRYGDRAIDRGWDESCMLHAVPVWEMGLSLDNGRVIHAYSADEPEPKEPSMPHPNQQDKGS